MTHDRCGTPAVAANPSEEGSAWQSLVEGGMDHLVCVSHVAAPDELPSMVADAAAAFFAGQDTTIYLADLQQRLLVPFQPVGQRSRAEFPHVLGVDTTVAGRAFQQMQQLTQAASAESEGDRVRMWQPLIDGTDRLGVLGLTVPTAALDDDAGMRRLERFTSVVAELVVTKTMYGDSIVRLRRTSQMSLAAEVQWSLLPPLTFANHSVTIAGGLEPAYEVAGDSLDYAVDDATLLLVEWHGTKGPGDEPPPLSLTGDRALHPGGSAG